MSYSKSTSFEGHNLMLPVVAMFDYGYLLFNLRMDMGYIVAQQPLHYLHKSTHSNEGLPSSLLAYYMGILYFP